MYRNSVFDFSDKEIDQIVEMVKNWGGGDTSPIDRRKVSRQVMRWAEGWGLVKRGSDMCDWDGSVPWFVKDAGRFYYSSGQDFMGVWVLPQEALWRLVEPMVRDRRGHSITRDSRWNELNIYAEGQTGWSARALGEMIRVLCILDQWGYLVFQYAGSVWAITLTPENAMRSEL